MKGQVINIENKKKALHRSLKLLIQIYFTQTFTATKSSTTLFLIYKRRWVSGVLRETIKTWEKRKI